jgi:hypothetical protein
MFDGLTFRQANSWIHRFAQAADVREGDLLNLLDCLPGFLTQFPDFFVVETRNENVTWRNYETLVWSVGEVFRQILKRDRFLRRSQLLWRKIEAVCLDPRYGKGRESFTMLLGIYGGRERFPVLIQLLEDPEVHGHALYALRLLSMSGAQSQAERLLHSPRTWIRREARKYLEKISKKKLQP